MKKKYTASIQDKKDWTNFTENVGKIPIKNVDLESENIESSKIKKLDLHGLSLDKANKEVERFIIKSYDSNRKKILIVTGRGSRSKIHNDPYVSNKFGILKYSVPEFIKNNINLKKKIHKIIDADIKDGGEGAIYVFLKKNNY